ncbi:hypothetical protein [Denitromonas ohlonensis]|jgi:hypothetical protein|nr:hypothetical protein [Denitromonas ohlonensis]MCZ4305262.1 hypothetical protein [Zoogloeaceae bacterium G21618-S1]
MRLGVCGVRDETLESGWSGLFATMARVLVYCALVLAVQAPEVFGL